MKYFVIGRKFDEEFKAAIEYIAGEFDEYFLAEIFRKAYNEHFKANATIKEFDPKKAALD